MRHNAQIRFYGLPAFGIFFFGFFFRDGRQDDDVVALLPVGRRGHLVLRGELHGIEDAQDLRGYFCGSTGGEVYGMLGAALKRIVRDSRLPQYLVAEIREEITQIDAAYDRVCQPRPFTMKVEPR